MDIIQAIIIGIVQGLTEFLPISSSAHLVFIPYIMDVNTTLAFDTLLHIGSLVAVVAYFWKDIVNMIKAFFSSLMDIPRAKFKQEFKEDQYKKLAWFVIIGTIPAGLMGIFLKDFFEGLFNNIPAVGVFLIITGFLLWGSEKVYARNAGEKKSVKEMGVKNTLLIGVAQGCAIAPGISRSGATITTGLFLGLERELAARFSFLLSIPAILGAALIQMKDISSGFDLATGAFIAGFLAAAISGYLAIKILLKIIKERTLNIFAYYCWAVGIISLVLSFYFGII